MERERPHREDRKEYYEEIEYIFLCWLHNACNSNRIYSICIKSSRSVFSMGKWHFIHYLHCVCYCYDCYVLSLDKIEKQVGKNPADMAGFFDICLII